jgi:sporulation protein YlmC with PRC-barrel domain
VRFSEAKGHRVMSTSEAVTVGRVKSLVVDVPTARVVALQLRKTPGEGSVLTWGDMSAFGRDAITVESGDVITVATGDLARLSDKHHDAIGKRVLTTEGVELGTVQDIDFDLTDGSIVSVLTQTDEIDGSRLLDLGSYAIIVRPA